jgi:hypothetical protein
LQIQRQADDKTRVAAHHEQHAHRSGGDRPRPEKAHVEQRIARTPPEPPLVGEEQGGGERASCETGPAPGRPAVFAPKAQWHDKRQHRRGEQPGTDQVEPLFSRRCHPRKRAPRDEQQRRPDQHIEEKCRAPRGSEQIRGDEESAQNLPCCDANREDHRVRPERAGPSLSLELDLDHREHLRRHERRRRTLEAARSDQKHWIGRETADQ